MKKIILTLIAIVATSSLFAQNSIDELLNTIEQNNTTLKALRESADAQKLGQRTGLSLPDPEIGFNYLWGNPSTIGKRQDLSIKQSFDFPTITGLKRKVADQQNKLVDWQYKADRMSLLLEAKNYDLDWIYYNSLVDELTLRLAHAEAIAVGQKERLKSGEGNILEYNNAQLNLSNVKGEISRIETERNNALSQLTRLNGGKVPSFNPSRFEAIDMPIDFLQWYSIAEEKNPILSYVKQEVELSKKQVALSRSMGLPTLSTGYMSEKVVGQRYQGVSIGISIPLWSNKNRVKQAKSAVRAAESRKIDTKQQFFIQLQTLYSRTLGLKKVAETYRTSLKNANNSTLLKQALDSGQISMLDYIVEVGLYYNTIDQALKAELDYQKAFAELSAVEL
ncbi:MAG: TolC family protein [Bacteroides sp.]